MPSLIPGYQYDIFISYRQKDNKYDGWVSEFVDHLKKELGATFKEDLSIYFDENPLDGLLETHNVDKSLEDKLKCLIFIPVISQTYCDPNSFAWQHEFCAFNKLAKEEQFGRDVRLASGNVASRILPVKIHDLDPEDKTLLENEMSGVLRSIEFIYVSAGVKRPLRANEDHPRDNLNKTYYRDQINKVANAVKEIINALKKPGYHSEEVSIQDFELKPSLKKKLGTKIITASFILLALIIFGYFFIPKLFKENQPEKSIAVLPFVNDSPDQGNAYFVNGLMDEILINLQKIKAFSKVISRTSTGQFIGPDRPTIPDIAKKLGINYIVEGSGQKYGNSYRLRVQLIDAKNDKHLWAESYEKEIRDTKDIYDVQAEIAQAIARELEIRITPQEEVLINKVLTNNTLAYDYYLRGNQFVNEKNNSSAIDMYSKAIELDPEFALAYLGRANLYSTIYGIKLVNWEGKDHLARLDLEKAMKINPDLPEVKMAKATQLYRLDRNNDEALKLLDEIKPQMVNNSDFLLLHGGLLRRKGLWQESAEEMIKSSRLDPLIGQRYVEIGRTFMTIRKYHDAMVYFVKPDSLGLYSNNRYFKFSTLLLWKGDLESALETNNYYHNTSTDFYYRRQFRKMIPLTKGFDGQLEYSPKTLKLAEIFFFAGDIRLSRIYADSAIAELNLKIIERSDDERYFEALGYAYAFKSDKQKSINNAKKAINLRPLEADALDGFFPELNLTKIYILTGEYDLAMDKIEYLLTIPGTISVPLLKIDPVYDKLRGLPRFQKILANEYKTNYK